MLKKIKVELEKTNRYEEATEVARPAFILMFHHLHPLTPLNKIKIKYRVK